MVLLGCASDGDTSDAGAHTASATATTAATVGSGGSGTSSSSAGTTGGGGSIANGGSGGTVDGDGDGLDDAFEAKVAADYLPFLSFDPSDGCPLGGIVYRVTPHPQDAARLWIIYDHLLEKDCGLNGHVGDDEVFGVTVDPKVPPPDGIVAIKAIAHQSTICEKTTECGKCGLDPCTTQDVGGKAVPVVFSSKDKHGSYTSISACSGNCFDSCTLAPTSSAVPLVNAGEPDGHLTENLTTNGFITAANGWTEASLMDFNPWEAGKEFGSASVVADDLVDTAFVATVCP